MDAAAIGFIVVLFIIACCFFPPLLLVIPWLMMGRLFAWLGPKPLPKTITRAQPVMMSGPKMAIEPQLAVRSRSTPPSAPKHDGFVAVEARDPCTDCFAGTLEELQALADGRLEPIDYRGPGPVKEEPELVLEFES